MKNKISLLIAVIFSLFNGQAFAQWSTSGSNIYYSTGNVGIGTSTPLVKFDVRGDMKLYGNLDFWNDDTGLTYSSSLLFHNTTKNKEVMAMNQNGVTFRAQGTASNNLLSLVGNTGGSIDTWNIWVNEDNNLVFKNQNAYNFTAVHIAKTGWVGIGTDDPLSALHVEGGITASSYLLNGSPIVSSPWGMSTSNIYFNTGLVGVGTTTPSDKLDVNGNIRVRGIGSWAGDKAKIVYADNQNVPQFIVGYNPYNSGEDYGFHKANGASQLVISPDGNVSIGTSPTDARFTVKIPTTGTTVALHAQAGGDILMDAGGVVLFDGNSNVATGNYIGAPLTNTQAFFTAGAERMRITSAGNVAIGTTLGTNPNNYKLAVNGAIGAKEVRVENTSTAWADYVFENDYRLMSLGELESYIRENKHLPEVPSKKDVEANGHSLGEMDVTLLKKVEELTLYMIELKKELEALKAATGKK